MITHKARRLRGRPFIWAEMGIICLRAEKKVREQERPSGGGGGCENGQFAFHVRCALISIISGREGSARQKKSMRGKPPGKSVLLFFFFFSLRADNH